jgi:membrane protease YdiL (CAAX protease family)
MPGPLNSLLQMLFAAAILAGAVGLPVLAISLRVRKANLFPRGATWEAPWSGWALVAAFGVALLLPSLVQIVLSDSGLFQALYGPDFPTKPPGPNDLNNLEYKRAAHLRGLWAQAIAVPLQVAVLLAGFRFGSGAPLKTMGLTRERWRPNLALGYLGWLILAPLAFAAFALAILLLAPNPDKHPLTDLGERAGRREWILFAFQAVVLAPALEELLFRGLLLPWLLRPPKSDGGEPELILKPQYRGHVVYAAAVLLATQTPTLTDALRSGQARPILDASGPFLFLMLLLPLYLILPFSRRVRRWAHLATPQAVRACFADAALFAAVHANVWPSPIPLFILGLGLAWLTARTHSLVPALIAHALFNAVAVVYLALGGGA